jgi:hypothetical protein
LPTYSLAAPPLSYPVHWAHVDLPQVPIGFLPAAEVFVGVADSGDGPYDFRYSAESFGNVLGIRQGTTVILDTTPPAITIGQPQATTYAHSAMLTLNYSADDGAGSGVQSVNAQLDGMSTLAGQSLQSGQTISLLTQLTLGTHTFSVTATDNVNNAATSNVTFTVVVTPDSIKDDVTQFLQSGAIDNGGIANSLLAKLNAAAKARERGDCAGANDIYQAFISELQAQSGKHVDPTAVQIMIADAQYLITHCP